MPFCGFNQKMLEGLIAFHEGLVEHGLVERSRTRSQSVGETLQRELSDMDRFLGTTYRITDPEAREAIQSLTKYAQDFYRLVERNGIDNYKQTVQSLSRFYAEMDRKFYSDLEGQPNDMEKLAQYLNLQRI